MGTNRHEYNRKYYIANIHKLRRIARNRHYLNGRQSMKDNIDCAKHLGCYINEKMAMDFIPNTELMNSNNPGYDLIYNKKYLIDAKASTIRTRDDKYKCWTFHIEQNKVPDYFLLTAYNNRETLEICHMWLIPGIEINDRISISISPSTIHKWDCWKIMNKEDVTGMLI